MKNLVRHNFSRAIATYNQFGKTQQAIAADLGHKLSYLPSPTSILEIGCGTGFLSQHLTGYKCLKVLSDLSPAMVATLNKPTGLAVALDGELLPFQTTFDWIVSSLAFQWFEKPDYSLPLLKKHGNTLAFTTLGQNNFHEWKEFCHRHNIEDRTRPMLSANKLKEILGSNTHIEEAYYSEHHPNWLTFWDTIYKIGAHTSSSGHKKTPLAKSLLQGKPITCTYHVLTVISR